jgi:2-polyprenyl-3-methyl-5-hydroxy-6-metoxy-1,4-benzoquinol methylase
MSQNIFDNDVFFKKYSELRKKEYSYNNLVEQPAIKALLPELEGRSVLDLGCGHGSNCVDFVNRGAAGVVGIDISQKMLDVAKKENSHELIEYMVMDMSEIGCLKQKFDLVFSSFALHYVKDFGKLLDDIRHLLNENGILLFSQEHPYTTAPKCGPSWTKDAQGIKIHYNLADYMCSGVRHTKFFANDDVAHVVKYHQPLSEIIGSIISQGFVINNVVEPVPDEYALEKRPDLYDEFHKTTCIIIKATRVFHGKHTASQVS